MSKNLVADVIVDLQYGDCGKGKVTNSLMKSGEYTHCVRFNGGHNAGGNDDVAPNGKTIHIDPA